MSQDCLFCKIIAGSIPSETVFEDEVVKAFMDIRPTNQGHVLVVPKIHSTGLFDADEATLEALFSRIRRIAMAVKQAVGADGINIMQNEGAAAGQVIQHLHIHIVPRFEGDGFQHWHGKTVPSGDELKKTAELIRASLSS